jgi:hypothetical protein
MSDQALDRSTAQIKLVLGEEHSENAGHDGGKGSPPMIRRRARTSLFGKGDVGREVTLHGNERKHTLFQKRRTFYDHHRYRRGYSIENKMVWSHVVRPKRA